MEDVSNMVDGSIRARASFAHRSTRLQRMTSEWRLIACVQVFDFLGFSLVGYVLFSLLLRGPATHWGLSHLLAPGLMAAATHCVYQCFRLYDFAVIARGRDAALRAITAGLVSFGPIIVALLGQQNIFDETTKSDFGLLAAGLAGAAISRLVIARLADTLRRAGVVGRRIYTISDSMAAAEALRRSLEFVPDNRVVGSWILSGQNDPIEEALQGALRFLRVNPVDVVVLKLPLSEPERLIGAARVLRSVPRTVMLAVGFDGLDDRVMQTNVTRFGGLGKVMLVKLSDRPLAGWRWVVKDVQDRLLALILLAVVSPVMLLIMLAIKISDPGPVFFRQKRFGYGGVTFDIIKFRTMRPSKVADTPQSLVLTKRDDPRIFAVGRILRKTSLDELPQLLNVLRGEMWLVGPRPHSPYAEAGGRLYRQAVQEYAARYRIKPGITGWAQVSGWRGPTDTLEQLANRVACDLHYIENWSVMFDIRILLKTVGCAFGHENAF